VVAQIGAGGMGEVYKARDTKLKRDVAVKVLPQEFVRDADHVSRFNREAEVLASLNHPNLAAIYNVGEYEGRPFIVMELLEGQTLKARIEGERIPASKILELAIQISDALDSAHARGVVHRDIKPANIHITTSGQSKILDFGIAKLIDRIAGDALTSAPTSGRSDHLTEAGVAIGTIAYMSPEQIRGEELDARTDLFSFGLVLYEMTTGRQAFSGGTSGVIFEAILNRSPIAPVQLNPSAPQELQRIINKLLEKDRKFRYQSAADLRNDLERLKRESDSGHRPAAAAVAEKKSIVVLPFADISASRDNEYFSDGLTDEIITDLSQIQTLRVISRNSSMQLKGSGRDLKSIAQDLKVQYVLEGTVRKAGESLRVTAQLIDALSDAHLWADKYSGKLEDVFDIQEQISRKIVDALKMKLSSQEDRRLSERPVANIHAFECYHRARVELYKFTEEGLANALGQIRTALTIVGDNELLYAAMGTVYWQYVNAAMPNDDTYLDKADECARKIFQLNPDSSVGLQVLGLVQYHRGQRAEAVRTLKRAIAIEPNNVFVLGELCRMYFIAGKSEAARSIDAQGFALDPLTPIMQFEGFIVEFFAGEPGRKLQFMLQFLKTYPDFVMPRVACALALIHQGHMQEARSLVEAAPEEKTPSISGLQCAFIRHALAGRRDEALRAVSEPFKAAARRVEYWSWVMSNCYALIDELDQALDWLEIAISRGFINYPFLSQHDKLLAKLHGHPRFEALMQKAKYEFDRFDV